MNKNDFPTYEESEEQVRRDMQCLHDETRAALNALVDELALPGAAAELGAAAPGGLSGRTVQELINGLAAALGELGGSVELEGGSLAALVAAAVEKDVLTDYYTGEETEAALAALGISGLETRLEDVEEMLGKGDELLREHPFIMPATELAGAASLMSTGKNNRVFSGDRLLGIVAGEESMELVAMNVLTGEKLRTAVSGSTLPVNSSSTDYTVCWLDGKGAYMIFRAGVVWYLISLTTGICSQLVAGSDNTFCGAARLGNIVTAVFHCSGTLSFYRRSVAGDGGEAPAITALDTCEESGSARDRVLGVCGDSVFAMLKCGDQDSTLKLYAPADMSCSAEYAVGIPGAYAGGVRLWGEECFFRLTRSDGCSFQAKCGFDLSGSVRPVLTVGGSELPGSRVIARGEGVVYAAAEDRLYILDAETMAQLDAIELPDRISDSLCAVEGAELEELWGGEYILVGLRMFKLGDMSVRYLRCAGEAPSGYALGCSSGRYFVARKSNSWYLFDSLLRPVWGMAPADHGSDSGGAALSEPDISGFGTMATR